MELKVDKSVDTAIDQIKEKNYPAALEKYKGNIHLVGISYDKRSRNHFCLIERG